MKNWNCTLFKLQACNITGQINVTEWKLKFRLQRYIYSGKPMNHTAKFMNWIKAELFFFFMLWRSLLYFIPKEHTRFKRIYLHSHWTKLKYVFWHKYVSDDFEVHSLYIHLEGKSSANLTEMATNGKVNDVQWKQNEWHHCTNAIIIDHRQ